MTRFVTLLAGAAILAVALSGPVFSQGGAADAVLDEDRPGDAGHRL
jgi:hypothetical protein